MNIPKNLWRQDCQSQKALGPFWKQSPQNHLSRVQRSSHKLSQQMQTLYGYKLYFLHIHYGYVAWCSCATASNDNGGCLWLLLVTFSSSYLASMSSLNTLVSFKTFCISFCYVLFRRISLGCLLFLFLREYRVGIGLGERRSRRRN